MTNPRLRRAGLAAVLAAGGVLAVAGCTGSTGTGAAGPTTAPTSANTAPITATGTVTAPPPGSAGGGPATTTRPGGPPECTSAGLALSFGGSDAGMNQQERVLRFTNTSGRTCAIVGFPGVSFVTGDNGSQVGQAAGRDGPIGAQVNLAPGAVAATVLHYADSGAFDQGACRPVPVRGYRVYPPDETASKFIAVPAGMTACSGSIPQAQLSVSTIKAGAGDPDNP